eukprot:4862315-Prymnesium_polylepis.1
MAEVRSHTRTAHTDARKSRPRSHSTGATATDAERIHADRRPAGASSTSVPASPPLAVAAALPYAPSTSICDCSASAQPHTSLPQALTASCEEKCASCSRLVRRTPRPHQRTSILPNPHNPILGIPNPVIAPWRRCCSRREWPTNRCGAPRVAWRACAPFSCVPPD